MRAGTKTTISVSARRAGRWASRSFFMERHAGTAALFGLLVLGLVGTVLGYLAGTGLAGLLSHLGLSDGSLPFG